MSLEKQIFKNGSTTYYFSSKFFPRNVRQDVFKLYSFVRVADDYVDSIPQNKKEFKILCDLWADSDADPNFDAQHHSDDSLNERVVKNIVQLSRKYDFESDWIQSFLDSMRADLDKKTYTSLDGSLWYVYGSAEVIGLMMAKIMRLPDEAMPYAAMQGRAMQWINFIRDIQEDITLGRQYFPNEDLKKFGLLDLQYKSIINKQSSYNEFIHFQLSRYRQWQTEAQKGFRFLPKQLFVPLKTATDMYNWTAKKIEEDPLIVYEKQIKPKKLQVIKRAVKNSL